MSLTLQTQIAVLGGIIQGLKDAKGDVPDAQVTPVLENVQKVREELGEMLVELEANAGEGLMALPGPEMQDREAEVNDLIDKMKTTMANSKPSVAVMGELGKVLGKLSSEVSTLHGLQRNAFPGKSAVDLGGRPLMKLTSEMTNQRTYTGPHWLSPSHLHPNNEIQGRVAGPPGRVEGGMVVHAAGVLADGLIMPNHGDLGKKFSKCMASKAHGAWHIHRMMAAF